MALVLKHQQIARDVAEIRGIPSKYVASEQEVTALLAKIQQAQQAAQQLQMAQGMAESLGKAAPALRELTRMQPPGQGGSFETGRAA